MPILYKGASTVNNDLSAGQDPDALAKRKGYIGGGEFGINNHFNSGPASPDWSPTGMGNEVQDGYTVGGTNAYDHDVARDRSMGAASQGRQAVQLDQTASNQSRGLQMGALGMMAGAARGQAPSRAAELGRASTDNTIRAGAAAAAGGRGPGGALVANNGAQVGSADQFAHNNAQVTDLRAAEMGQAQKEYAQGAQSVEGQDIGAATTQAQLEEKQRALNESRQQNYERLGWNTRKSQQQAADDWQRIQDQENQTRAQQQLAVQARTDATTDNAINTAESMAMAAAGSDTRMKTRVRPVTLGSLANLMHPTRK